MILLKNKKWNIYILTSSQEDSDPETSYFFFSTKVKNYTMAEFLITKLVLLRLLLCDLFVQFRTLLSYNIICYKLSGSAFINGHILFFCSAIDVCS